MISIAILLAIFMNRHEKYLFNLENKVEDFDEVGASDYIHEITPLKNIPKKMNTLHNAMKNIFYLVCYFNNFFVKRISKMYLFNKGNMVNHCKLIVTI